MLKKALLPRCFNKDNVPPMTDTRTFEIFTPQQQYAPYACRPEQSRGRLYDEPGTVSRSAFQRDRDRIIHSAAFRRLKHKTQVFVYHEGDYYRTRLTHSIEVAQIARSITRVLGLNEDIAEALSLAHDFGHTPFGHAGEDALNEAMMPFGGFDHNAQSLRVVTMLERRYASFDGLNLTWETLEGLAKHNGPLCAEGSFDNLPEGLALYNDQHNLELHTHASAEAQIAALSDDIAYNNHDVADGLKAGLFSMDELRTVPLVDGIADNVRDAYGDLSRSRLIHEIVRRLINMMVNDLLTETRRRLNQLQPTDANDIRQAGQQIVSFSAEMKAHDKALKSFLMTNMYRHYKVNRMASKARRVIRDLFSLYVAEPECLPTEWREAAFNATKQNRKCYITSSKHHIINTQ